MGADSLSENEENESPDNSAASAGAADHKIPSSSDKESEDFRRKQAHLPPQILEKILRRGGSGKAAQRQARVAHVKRVRKAQEIQRLLEELDEQHRELEEKGIQAEKTLRGEDDEDGQDGKGDADLMASWFKLLSEKNKLIRREQELLVSAKQLELEDRSARLEGDLRECLMLDSRSPESAVKEGEVLKELLEISEHREKLQAMLERDKARYVREDKDMEAQMAAKGISIT